MSKIKFEKKIVAFIDILGFKVLVNKSENEKKVNNELINLINTLESAIPNLDSKVSTNVPTEAIPTYTYISDCIILSAPIKYKEYDGLSIILMRCIQLTHLFLEKGYLVRGGIDVGNVWHTESNVVGSAYQEAYNLENEFAKNPRILFSKNTEKLLRENESLYHKMFIKDKKDIIVNGLHSYYIPDKYDKVEDAFKKYINIIDDNIKSDSKYKDKWEYIKNKIIAYNYDLISQIAK